MNGLFTGVFIDADDITLLAPSRASMVLMLEKCESFALTHDILFNALKTNYMIFKRCESVHTAPLYFKLYHHQYPLEEVLAGYKTKR